MSLASTTGVRWQTIFLRLSVSFRNVYHIFQLKPQLLCCRLCWLKFWQSLWGGCRFWRQIHVWVGATEGAWLPLCCVGTLTRHRVSVTCWRERTLPQCDLLQRLLSCVGPSVLWGTTSAWFGAWVPLQQSERRDQRAPASSGEVGNLSYTSIANFA